MYLFYPGPCYSNLQIKVENLIGIEYCPGYDENLMTAWNAIVDCIRKG